LARRGAIVLDNARLYRQAQEANRLKDQFLAMVSHELRTPLTPILGAAMLLKGHAGRADDDNKIVNKLIELIERNARVQAQIVDDLLDISRIVSGKLNLFSKAVDITVVVRNALEAFRAAYGGGVVRIDSVIDPVQGTVYGDAARLQQVLNNLLSNAVKFTPAGGTVRVHLRQKSPDWVEIAVTDTGKGIAPEFLPFVFDRFRQADTFTTRTAGGLGLGLAITRDLVELHGGRVSATSEGIGKGATFIVELPLHRPVTTPDKAVEHRTLQ
jgi:signal transduction histidine kinase